MQGLEKLKVESGGRSDGRLFGGACSPIVGVRRQKSKVAVLHGVRVLKPPWELVTAWGSEALRLRDARVATGGCRGFPPTHYESHKEKKQQQECYHELPFSFNELKYAIINNLRTT